MGKEDEVLEAAAKNAPAFVFADITRVNKAGINMDWNRVLVSSIENWRKKFIEIESKHCYRTIQRFENAEVTEGEAYISPLYFDLDSDNNLQETLDDVKKIKDYHNIGLDLGDKIQYFFSGNRGFHITIHEDLFGMTPHNDLSKVLRYMAEHIAEKLSIKTFDRTVYSKRRMWRMVNTQHGKTGLWKIPLTSAEIGTLSIDDIKNLAIAPRELELDI